MKFKLTEDDWEGVKKIWDIVKNDQHLDQMQVPNAGLFMGEDIVKNDPALSIDGTDKFPQRPVHGRADRRRICNALALPADADDSDESDVY